ncbi:hypothetical protein QSU93_09690 [Limosilactobacillus fermentum]|uniref:hypothetical protein n=1 Tax=Limosilactobacillus fermentum TaxID=1613 RepID=UPI00256FC3A3|nr:hypothetical protein [Limosilactobacillus fermentum]WJD84686.1 hypothetical protein QSU93_09690 [Limosilactobacillus fermentum]
MRAIVIDQPGGPEQLKFQFLSLITLALAVTVAIAAFLIHHIAVADAICTGTRTAFLAGHTSLAVFFFHFHPPIFEIGRL